MIGFTPYRSGPYSFTIRTGTRKPFDLYYQFGSPLTSRHFLGTFESESSAEEAARHWTRAMLKKGLKANAHPPKYSLAPLPRVHLPPAENEEE